MAKDAVQANKTVFWGALAAALLLRVAVSVVEPLSSWWLLGAAGQGVALGVLWRVLRRDAALRGWLWARAIRAWWVLPVVLLWPAVYWFSPLSDAVEGSFGSREAARVVSRLVEPGLVAVAMLWPGRAREGSGEGHPCRG